MSGERPSPLHVGAVATLGVALVATFAFGWPRLARLQHGVEAMETLGRVARGAAIYYVKPRLDAGGVRMPCQFPPGVARITEAQSCCDPRVNLAGTPYCDPAKVDWNKPIWRAMSLALDAPQAFIWVYEGGGTFGAARYQISAYADLDCDGVFSTFRMVGQGDPKATAEDCVLHTSPAFTSAAEEE